jgi:hypothetical protein
MSQALIPYVGKKGAQMAVAALSNKQVRDLVVQAGRSVASKAMGAAKTYMGGGGKPTRSGKATHYEQMGVAVSAKTRNGTQIHVSKNIRHKEWGSGIRCTGSQYYTSCITDGSTTNLLSGSGATVGANSGYLSPDAWNGRLALLGRNYQRYAFRRVKWTYIPRCASTQAGGFAMAYTTDPSANTFSTVNYARAQDFNPSVDGAFREPSSLQMTYTGDNTWFTELDATSDASNRMTVQGMFYAFPDASSIGAVTQGHIRVDYVVDFFGLSADYGFSVTLKSQEEVQYVKDQLKKLRASQKPRDEDCVSISSRSSSRF